MEYRKLGKSGLHVSALSFGSWVTFGSQVDESSAIDCMKYAYDAGVNFFDNAEVYGNGESERIMGKVLKKLGWGRDTFIVSSKVFWGGDKPSQKGLNRKHVYDACNAALQRLQVDYLDLFYCHRPDALTPVEETVRAMDVLIRQGKVLYWGTSEWNATQISEAYGVARQYGLTPPTMEQPEYNMFSRQKVEKEYLPLFANIGLGTTTWSPLASGLLTGKYTNGVPKDSRAALKGYEWLQKSFTSPEGKAKVDKTKDLQRIAENLDVTLAKLAIGWCLRNPCVSTVILGASRLDQLKENLEALNVVAHLDDEVLGEIESILQNRPKPEPVY